MKKNFDSFNVFYYIIELTNQTQIFLLGVDNYALIVHSKNYFLKNFNKYKSNLLTKQF